MKKELAGRVKDIPNSPGVYMMKNINGDVIYVGKAKNLKKRVSQYFSGRNSGIKTEHLVSKIRDIETIVSKSELDAFLLENTLIKQYKPRYNISLKDDKSYPYIKIVPTKTGFPYIIKTRNFKKDGGEYFGPYSSSFAVTQTIKTADKIFKIRTCSDNKFNFYSAKKKPCLYYQINMCSAPCCGYVTPEAYKKSIEDVRLLLKGRNRQLLSELKKSMEERVSELNFEAAIKLRDKINSIIAINEKQAVVLKNEKDIDSVGFYASAGSVDFVVLIIRNGRVTGTKNFFFKNIYLGESEMLSSFLSRYYSKNMEISSDIPDEILIPAKIDEEDKNVLLEYIGRLSSKKAKILQVGKGERNKKYEAIADMAFDNARKNFLENAASIAPLSGDAGRVPLENRELKLLDVLKNTLRLNKFPAVMECFDISNISGTYAVGSKAVFVNGEKDASLYRRYRIRSKDTPDDYAMMFEVLSRRFNNAVNGEDPLPDLILVDGGKGQLNVLSAAAKEFIGDGLINAADMPALAAIAKVKDLEDRRDKIYLPNRKNEVNFGESNKNREAVFLLMRLRDEAHRFAVAYFSNIKAKSLVTSELMNIEGVGKRVYSILMNNFGSVENIKNITEDGLSAVKGISKKTAKNIYGYFH